MSAQDRADPGGDRAARESEGTPRILPDAHRRHYDELTHAEQCAAIKRLASEGTSPYSIAAATGLSVEAVRAVLGELGGA